MGGFVLYSPQKVPQHTGGSLMGNRGTTPSWDEEEIAKWGLFGHWSFTTRRIRAEIRRQHAEQVAKYLEAVIALLPEDSEENRIRVARAIPQVIICREMGDTGFIDWKDRQARALYEDWCDRKIKFVPFRYSLCGMDVWEPFLTIVYAILFVLDNQPETT